MAIFHSIRTKLTLWYAFILGFTLIGSGLVAWFVTRETLMENLDRSLRSEVKWVNEFIEPKAKKIRLKRSAERELELLKRNPHPVEDEGQGDISDEERAQIDDIWNQIYQHTLLNPRRHFIQIVDRNGDLLYRSASLQGHNLQYFDIPYGWINVVSTMWTDGQELRLATTQNDYVKILVAYPLEPINEVLDNMFSNFKFIAPISLLISIIGGWFLAHQSLKPVDEVTRTAKEITAQNLTRRLPNREVDDEIGRLIAQFNDMIGRLRGSFEQMQKFSADASHELRTPLTIMRGEIEVALRNKRLTDTSRELLTSVHDELVRLSSIVESLMTLVKSDTGRLVFNFQPVALDDLIKKLKEDAEVLAEAKQIKVSLEQADPLSLKGDPVRLHQLVLNLIDNAVKYTEPHGHITLALRQDGERAIITVQDTGVGIPKKDQAHIFDRFYRGERERVNGSTGSGLGLSIARWIAEAHHGTIEVKSRERRGSTFTVSLPVSQT